MLRRLIAALASAVVLSGCFTSVTVEKSNGQQKKGLVYSLPATHLLVTPAADGSVIYQWVYLPDHAQEYVVTSSSFLSKYTLDVQTQNGLLTQVGSSQDSTAVAAQMLQTAEAVAVAQAAASNAAQSTGKGKKGGGGGGGGNGGGGNGGGGNGGGGNGGGGNGGGGNGGGGNGGGGNGGGGNGGGGNGGGGNGGGGKGGGGNGGGGNGGTGNAGNGNAGNGGGDGNPSGNATAKPSTGAIAGAWGPILFRVIQSQDGGVDLVPVSFPSMGGHGPEGGRIPLQPADSQLTFETNVLAHSVSFQTSATGASSMTAKANFPIAAVLGPESGIYSVNDSNTQMRTITAAIDSTDMETVTLKWSSALPSGSYNLVLVYRETADSSQVKAKIPFKIN